MQRDVHVPAICPDTQAGSRRLCERAKVVGMLQGEHYMVTDFHNYELGTPSCDRWAKYLLQTHCLGLLLWRVGMGNYLPTVIFKLAITPSEF